MHLVPEVKDFGRAYEVVKNVSILCQSLVQLPMEG
jgi:hypothetical protein